MTKFYRLYGKQRQFHVTQHDDTLNIRDAAFAVQAQTGEIVQGFQIHRSEPRGAEVAVVV